MNAESLDPSPGDDSYLMREWTPKHASLLNQEAPLLEIMEDTGSFAIIRAYERGVEHNWTLEGLVKATSVIYNWLSFEKRLPPQYMAIKIGPDEKEDLPDIASSPRLLVKFALEGVPTQKFEDVLTKARMSSLKREQEVIVRRVSVEHVAVSYAFQEEEAFPSITLPEDPTRSSSRRPRT